MTELEEGAEPLGAMFVPLRHNTAFRRLWTGQVISSLGTNVMLLAYPLLILDLTHSAVIAGAVGTARTVVDFIFRLPAGALADRLDRRRTMIACDSVRVAALGLLGVLVLTHHVNWLIVLVILAIDSAGDVLFDPSAAAALPVIVPSEQLESAWAATEGRQYAAALGGPALGGVLFAIGRAVPFLSDAFSYLISVVTVFGLRGRFRAVREGKRRSLLKETVDGVKTVLSDALLRAVLIQAPLINFAFAGIIFTVTLAMRRAGYSPTVIGLVQAAVGVGGLLGAVAAPRLQGRLPLSRLVVVLTGAGAVLFFLGAVAIPSPYIALPIGLTIFLAPTANAALFAVILRRTPDHSRGRVTNTVITAATALSALAPITAGIFVQDLSGAWAMTFFGGVMMVSAVMALLLKGLRAAEPGSIAATPSGSPPR